MQASKLGGLDIMASCNVFKHEAKTGGVQSE